jgi:hypothetical protein
MATVKIKVSGFRFQVSENRRQMTEVTRCGLRVARFVFLSDIGEPATRTAKLAPRNAQLAPRNSNKKIDKPR